MHHILVKQNLILQFDWSIDKSNQTNWTEQMEEELIIIDRSYENPSQNEILVQKQLWQYNFSTIVVAQQ